MIPRGVFPFICCLSLSSLAGCGRESKFESAAKVSQDSAPVAIRDAQFKPTQEIPQDRELIASLRNDLLTWHQNSLKAYDEAGSRNDKWNEDAKSAIDLMARWFCDVYDTAVELRQVHEPARRAVEAGCDDPMVLFVYARSSAGKNKPGEVELLARYEKAARALDQSAYPADRKYRAWIEYAYCLAIGQGKRPPETIDGIRKAVDRAMEWMIESAASPNYLVQNRAGWFKAGTDILTLYRVLEWSNDSTLEFVGNKFANTPELVKVCDLLRAKTLIDAGWKARGNHDARAIGGEQWQVFGAKLTEARNILDSLWNKHPDQHQFEIADMMLQIQKSIGGDRTEMEKWFERGMRGNPNAQALCGNKLDWLHPKWHGTFEDMVAFGRACRETHNWQSRMTLYAADAHLIIGKHLGKAEGTAYFAKAEVWDDIRSVYEEYLLNRPNAHRQRSEFAAFCYLCGKKLQAAREFRRLGDNLLATESFPKSLMIEARDAAYASDATNK